MLRTALYPRLKKLPLLYALNARVKSVQLRRGQIRLRDQYARLARERGVVYSEAAALDLMRAGYARRGLTPSPQPRGKLRIFWVGASWPQDNAGFLQGLRKLGEVVCFENEDGKYGLRQRFDGQDVESNARALRRQVDAMLAAGPVHLVLGQMWGHLVSVDPLREIQAKGIVTANIAMDDRLPDQWETSKGVRNGTIGIGEGLDMVLTSSPEVTEWYLTEGIPSVYCPMASDPERFKPYPESEKRYDVSFVGSKYGLRAKIVNAIIQAGIHVDAFGPGWPNGPADADQSAEIFGRSRIILGMGTIGHNDDLFTIKIRDFDAPMAGALYVTHRNPDLLQLYREGEEIACYLTIEECVHKIRYYLNHPEERIRVAAAGRARAVRDHTWEARLAHAFELMGILEASGR